MKKETEFSLFVKGIQDNLDKVDVLLGRVREISNAYAVIKRHQREQSVLAVKSNTLGLTYNERKRLI